MSDVRTVRGALGVGQGPRWGQTTTAGCLTVSLLLSVYGCQGQVAPPRDSEKPGDREDDGNPGNPGTAPTLPPELTPAPVAVRRLNGIEVRNTIADVLLAGETFSSDFQLDAGRHDFDNQYGGSNVTLRFAEELQSAAEKAATQFAARLDQALPCAKSVSRDAEPTCLRSFFDTTGRQLFRRALSDAERSNLSLVFDAVRADGDFAYAVGAVVEAMLQSPNFAFRTELGSGTSSKGAVSLAGYELASELSYFLWRSAPDQSLLDAAESGKLASASDVEAQAQRLLDDPRAKRGVRDFFAQWLEVEQLARGLEKSDPAFTPALRQAMWEETGKFVENLTLADDGNFGQLMTDPNSFVNKELASVYGISGPSGSGFEPVTLNDKQRGGVLTHPAFLAVHSSPTGFSPIFLGLFLRQKLLCQRLGQPPADIPAPSKEPNLSTREKFAQHSDSAACKGCHALMDPIGFGFERYDSVGRYREFEMVQDKQVALTGLGRLDETDVDGDFAGPVELANKLKSSRQATDCFVGHMMKFILGRDTALPDNRLAIDSATIDAIVADAENGSLPLKATMLALVKSPTFFHRTPASAAQGDKQ